MIDIIDEIRQLIGFYTGIKPHDVLRANIDQPAPTTDENRRIVNYATVLLLTNDLMGATASFKSLSEEKYTFKAKFSISFYGDYALENANKFMMGWRGRKGIYQHSKISKGGIEMATQVNAVFAQQNDLPRYNINCYIFYEGIMEINIRDIKTMSVDTTRVETDQDFTQTVTKTENT